MGEVTDLSERAWAGEFSGTMVQPGAAPVMLESYASGLAFVNAFSNVLALDTAAGLVLLDTSSPFHAYDVFRAIRSWTKTPLRTGIYSHGHVDHVFGMQPFEEEARSLGYPMPEVVAHENVIARFERYLLTGGYNGVINQRQFGFPVPVFPDQFRFPDRTLRDRMTLGDGALPIELFHDKGETDDHLWAWLPKQRALYTGDLFIWASPNCGNPQKVQRYPGPWAAALRKMDALGADLLFPGHGPPIVGEARVRQALTETAALLETLLEQTLRFMNQGARLSDVLHSVRAPEALLQRPYLRAVYDEPEFIVRNIWRLYGGWWDGNPAELKPAKDGALAQEVAQLAGGARNLIARADALFASDVRLACHLVEFAFRAAPADAEVRAARARIYRARIEQETSLMAKGIFGHAVREAEQDPPPEPGPAKPG